VDHEKASPAAHYLSTIMLILRHIGYYSVEYCFKVSFIGEIFTKYVVAQGYKVEKNNFLQDIKNAIIKEING